MEGPFKQERFSLENLWDVRRVAQFLGVSRSWVYQRVERGLMPCLRVGGLVRFKPSVVKAWTERTSVVPRA